MLIDLFRELAMRPGAAPRGWDAPRATRVLLVALSIGLLPIGTNLITPLFPVIQERMALGHAEVTSTYVAYVLAVVVGLPLVGHWSEYMGRRIVILLSLLLSIGGTILLIEATALPTLLAARALHGLAVAFATGAGTAGLRDMLPGRPDLSARITLVATVGGGAIGPLAGGLLSGLGDPLRGPYAIYLAVLALLIVPLALVKPRPPALRTTSHRYLILRPHRPAIPEQSRGVFFLTSFVGSLSFALFGFLLSIAPSHYLPLLGTSRIVGGLPAVLALASSALAQAIPIRGKHKAAASLAAMTAAILLIPIADSEHWPWALLLASVFMGSSQGIAFRSLFSELNSKLPGTAAARTVSLMYAITFLGSAVPVFGLGLAMDYFSPTTAVNVFILGAAATSLVFSLLCLAYGPLRLTAGTEKDDTRNG